VSESILHDSEPTRFVTELLDVWRSVGDEQTSQNLRAEYNNALVSLCKQIQKPFPSHVLGKANDLVRILWVA
jgi:hypothetical protein